MRSENFNAVAVPDAGARASQATPRKVRLAYLVSHPIQYQAPLLRRIAQEPDIDLMVFFGSDFSIRGYQDKGFGVEVKWDVPLLDGYRYKFLKSYRDLSINSVFSPISRTFTNEFMDLNGDARFDVLWVHGYASVNTLHGMLAAKSLGIPVLLRSDSWLLDRPRHGVTLAIKKVFFGILRHLADGVLSSGTHNANYWRYYLGDDFPNFLLPYAVDNEYFQRRSREAVGERDALREELGLEPGRPVILFASKLQTRKHCNDLIAAYAKMSRGAGLDPEPYLVIVGDGEERAALEKQAAATGFGSIRFCGFRNQSELPRFFDLCSVFVLPSRHEPWGLIVNEAMNAARAVIVSDDVGCQVDLITDGVEGCVYRVRDVDGLHTALNRVLATPEMAAEMGRRGHIRISKWNFDEDISGFRKALSQTTRKLS